MNWTEEIATYLAADSNVLLDAAQLVKGTTIFNAKVDTPDAMVAIISTGGRPARKHFSETKGTTWRFPTAQILCRGVAGDSATPEALAELVYESLGKIDASTLSGTFYGPTALMQDPFVLERDERDRVIWAFNVWFERRTP